MKFVFLLIISFLNQSLDAQQRLFTTYTVSSALVSDAEWVIRDFVNRVNDISPVISSKPVAILNTRPYLIFYSPKSNQVNLPIWHQVIEPQKEFFNQLAGSEQKGKEVFGLFFNGFYLAHELGHALKNAIKISDTSLYANEYSANVIAILYWKEVQRTEDLKRCYQYAKKFLAQLKNPVPDGEDPVAFFNTHYNELGADPYKYAYFQFNQFVQIYEGESTGNFRDYIKSYLSQ